MPWKQTEPVSQRREFILDFYRSGMSISESCRRFGISRKTGYKILKRHVEHGDAGLADASRAPHSHPNQTPAEIEAAVLRLRREHPTWGSKKLLALLERRAPQEPWPARSTIDAILKRAGLVTPRGKRRPRQPASKPRVEAHAPNDVWSIDYKGWFRVGDGTRCDPLTVQDVHSRASLVCDALIAPKTADVRRSLTQAFRSYGLPLWMLSDGGPPFGSTGLGRLSKLSVWLVRHGVLPVLTEPGRPDQNGRHERFHETLKLETARPPKASIRSQQSAFEAFQEEYNCVRPHEALGMKTPAESYEPSPRDFDEDPPAHSYEDRCEESRSVRRDGMIQWCGRYVFVGEAYSGEVIGLGREGDGVWRVELGPLWLGNLHERSRTIVPLPQGVTHVPGQRKDVHEA